jgi:hypothetical protein
MSESFDLSLGTSLPLSLTLPDGASGLFPQAFVYDSADSPVAGSPFDLSEVASTGRYTSSAFTPGAIGTFTALFITYTDAGHTTESGLYERDQDSFVVRVSTDLLLYEGAIWVDANNGVPGTVVGTNGWPGNPVDNLTDALTLSGSTGFRRLVIITGNVTLTASLTEFTVELRDETELNFGGQSVNGSEFFGGIVKGTMSGTVKIRNAEVEDVIGMLGTLEQCGITGTITLAVGATTMALCYSKVPGSGTPNVDFDGVASTLSLRAYSGGITIMGMTNAANLSTCEFIAGQIIVDASNTDGLLVVRGLVDPVTDNATGTTVDVTGVVNKPQVTDAVWDEASIDHVAAGSTGLELRTKLSTPQATQLTEVHQVHGLESGSPLVVSTTSRSAGSVSQQIEENAPTVGSVRVTRQ